MQLLDPIDPHTFLQKGVARSRLPQPVANMLVRRLDQLEYADMPSDHCDAGPRYRGSLEANASVKNMLETLWGRLASEDLSGLTKLFHASPEDHVINVIRLGDGYALDWHNHLAAKPTATLLVYLFSDETAGQGGDFVIGALEPDLVSVKETERLQISHGDAVLIGDMTHPLLQHKAERWSGQGWRYLISFAFNAQDW